MINVDCGERFTLNRLVKMLSEILGLEVEPEYAEARPGDVKHSMADISRAEELLGYRVEVDFREGLERTVEYNKVAAGVSFSDKVELQVLIRPLLMTGIFPLLILS